VIGEFEQAEKLSKRIAYYCRKINQYGAWQFDILRGRNDRQMPKTRQARLLCYKAEINRRLGR